MSSNILYYSNYCNNCKNILTVLAKSQIKDEMFYLCIDKRVRGKDGGTYLSLENGQQIMLPPTITKVPALLLINHGHRVLFGDDILNHFKHKEETINTSATMGYGEPMAYSFGGGHTGGVISDNFSFWDMTSDDLSAKGNGGLKQMYNYAVPNLDSSIETPPDNYTPDKIGNLSLDEIQQNRHNDIK